jgi:hypothetical protein
VSPKRKSAGKKAAATKRRAAARKAVATRKHRAAGRKAAKTRVRQGAARKAAATRSRKKEAALTQPVQVQELRSTDGFAGLRAINATPMTTSTADPTRNPTF